MEWVGFSEIIEYLKSAWAWFAGSVQAWKATLDPIVWLLGSLLALVPGTIAIFKWLKYRKSRLPDRLNELLTHEEQRLRTARSKLVQAIQTPDAASVELGQPLFLVKALQKILTQSKWSRWWHSNPLSAAEPEIENALVEIERQTQFTTTCQALCRNQEATAFLLKGAIAAARASKLEPGLPQWDRDNRTALNHFSRAAELLPNDAEAIEYVAHQHRVLGHIDLAKKRYEQLVLIASGSNSEVRAIRSRAGRYLAEMLEKQFDERGIQARLVQSRSRLSQALHDLPEASKYGLEHAAIFEVTGRVSSKQEQADATVAGFFDEALSIYDEVLKKEPQNSLAKAGLARMTTALAELRERPTDSEVDALPSN